MRKGKYPNTLHPISAVPGLYISDRKSAKNKALLQEHGITHVLTVMRWEDVKLLDHHDETRRYGDLSRWLDSRNSSERAYGRSLKREAKAKARSESCPESGGDGDGDGSQIQHKAVDLDDVARADLLQHLNGMLDWIRDAVAAPRPQPCAEETPQQPRGMARRRTLSESDKGVERGRVLVHCYRGISRSGAVVVAYIMRKLGIPYHAALIRVRGCRDIINPNIGFEYQLRLWQDCGYQVFEASGNDGVLVRKAGYERLVMELAGLQDNADDYDEWMRILNSRVRLLRLRPD